jgi:hypothetical protein
MLGSFERSEFQGSCHTITVGGIRSSAVRNMPLKDLLRRTVDCASRIVKEQLLLLGCHLAKEIAWLLPMVVL